MVNIQITDRRKAFSKHLSEDFETEFEELLLGSQQWVPLQRKIYYKSRISKFTLKDLKEILRRE